MKWSKLKQRIEANFVDGINGRVRLHLTAYRKFHDQPHRGTIIVDGEEWIEFCELKADIAQTEVWEQAKQEFPVWDSSQSKFSDKGTIRDEYTAYLNQVHARADEMKETRPSPILSSYDFTQSCFAYLNMDVGDALQSDNQIHQILAILDRRVGKRRLDQIRADVENSAVLHKFYTLRIGKNDR